MYQLDPAHFVSAPGLAWQACLKKTGVELELLTDNDMLAMVKNGTRGEMGNAVYRYAKADNKYMKNFEIFHQHIYSIRTQTIYMDGQCQKSCL